MRQFLVLYFARWNSHFNYNVVYCIRNSGYLTNSIDISIEITQITFIILCYIAITKNKEKMKLDSNTFRSLRNIS